jgi:hypothetical protein
MLYLFVHVCVCVYVCKRVSVRINAWVGKHAMCVRV